MLWFGVVGLTLGGALAVPQAERIVAGGIPECLHIGDTAEALVALESETAKGEIEFSVQSESGAVRASPDLVSARNTAAAVIFRGNVFGNDNITLSIPDRPDLAPVTTKISILPSIEPPRGIAAYPSVITLPADEGIAGSEPYSIVVLTWWAKIGAKMYAIQIFDGAHKELIRSVVSERNNSYVAYVKPGKNYAWQIRALIDTCSSGEIWTPYSILAPFDA
jgi:hypothetical protein